MRARQIRVGQMEAYRAGRGRGREGERESEREREREREREGERERDRSTERTCEHAWAHCCGTYGTAPIFRRAEDPPVADEQVEDPHFPTPYLSWGNRRRNPPAAVAGGKMAARKKGAGECAQHLPARLCALRLA